MHNNGTCLNGLNDMELMAELEEMGIKPQKMLKLIPVPLPNCQKMILIGQGLTRRLLTKDMCIVKNVNVGAKNKSIEPFSKRYRIKYHKYMCNISP